MDDIRAVMDAVDSKKAILFGHSEGGSVSALFAATYPNRTIALITFGAFAMRRYSDNYPWAPTDEERQKVYDMIECCWGSGDMNLADLASSKANDKIFMDWLANYFRSGASPSAALILTRMNTQVDIIGILPSIKVPTLMMQRVNDIDVKIEEGRFIAERIKGAKFIEFEGDDHLFWAGNTTKVLDEMISFIKHIKPYSTSFPYWKKISKLNLRFLKTTRIYNLAFMKRMELFVYVCKLIILGLLTYVLLPLFNTKGRRFSKRLNKIWFDTLAIVIQNASEESADFMNYGYLAQENISIEDIQDAPRNMYLHIASNGGTVDLSGKNLLEIGCGKGAGGKLIQRQLQFEKYTGIDLPNEHISIANKKWGGNDCLNFIQGDAENLPFDGETFDMVLNVVPSTPSIG